MFFKIKKLLENIRFRAEQQVRGPLRSYRDRICHFSVPSFLGNVYFSFDPTTKNLKNFSIKADIIYQ